MRYDDAALERALAALPLEETPPDLHARVLLALTRRAQPAFRPWELWVVGAALATCTWLVPAALGAPSLGGRLVAASVATWLTRIPQAVTGALTPSLLLWSAAGVLAAYAATLINRPLRNASPRR